MDDDLSIVDLEQYIFIFNSYALLMPDTVKCRGLKVTFDSNLCT